MSSKRRLRRRSCTGKKRHSKRSGAEQERRRLYNLMPLDGRPKLNVYKCRFCKGWHVGKAPAWLKRSGRR